MSLITGKIWGTTELLLANEVLEFHRIRVKSGGICSIHKHEHKINFFYVQEGKLLIKVWKNDYDLVDTTVLTNGEYTQVNPGEFHQFEAVEETTAFEIYWASTLNHSDIIRQSVGSLKEKNNGNIVKISEPDRHIGSMAD